jgi:hypothetical protein
MVIERQTASDIRNTENAAKNTTLENAKALQYQCIQCKGSHEAWHHECPARIAESKRLDELIGSYLNNLSPILNVKKRCTPGQWISHPHSLLSHNVPMVELLPASPLGKHLRKALQII